MPFQFQEFGGPLGLPIRPVNQTSANPRRPLNRLDPFVYPPIDLGPEDLVALVEREWDLRQKELNRVANLLCSEDIDTITAAAIALPAHVLDWLRGLESWMRLFYLGTIFDETPVGECETSDIVLDQRHALTNSFRLLWDRMFDTVRLFLTGMHYTDSKYNNELYVEHHDMVITVQEGGRVKCVQCTEEHALEWWAARQSILSRGVGARQGVAWLWQSRTEMEALVARRSTSGDGSSALQAE